MPSSCEHALLGPGMSQCCTTFLEGVLRGIHRNRNMLLPFQEVGLGLNRLNICCNKPGVLPTQKGSKRQEHKGTNCTSPSFLVFLWLLTASFPLPTPGAQPRALPRPVRAERQGLDPWHAGRPGAAPVAPSLVLQRALKIWLREE